MTAGRLPVPTIHRTGAGPTVVLLHSLGANHHMWDGLAPLLPGHSLVSYDLPGHGDAPVPDAPYRIDDAARQLVEVIGETGGRSHVVGLSIGGLVALQVAAERPDLVDRLVLVDSVAVYPEMLKQQWSDRADSVPRNGMASVVDATLTLCFTAGYLEGGGPAVAQLRDWLLACNPDGYGRSCEALEEVDLTDRAGRVTAPTLVVCGEDDAPPFLQAARWFGETIPGASLHWLTQARHAGALEQPAQFADALRAFKVLGGYGFGGDALGQIQEGRSRNAHLGGRLEQFAARGGTIATGAVEVAAAVEVVVLSLPNAVALAETVAALRAAARPGLVVVEASTLSVADKVKACEALADVGVHLLDCPMSGTGQQARKGDLVAYLSGDDSDAKAVATTALAGFVRRTIDVGAFGNGSKMKFVANLLVAVHNTSAAEALLLAERAGLPLDLVIDAVGDGAGGSKMLQVRGPRMAERRYSDPTATVATMEKDLALITAFATELGSPTPLLSVASSLYRFALEQDRQDEDTACVFGVLERLGDVVIDLRVSAGDDQSTQA